MDTIQVAKNHAKLRDEAIEKKLKEAIAFLDKEEIKQVLFNKIVNKYLPKESDVIDVLENKLNLIVEQITVNKIKDIIQQNIKQTFLHQVEKKIEDMIDTELDRRLSSLIKYHDEY